MTHSPQVGHPLASMAPKLPTLPSPHTGQARGGHVLTISLLEIHWQDGQPSESNP